MPWHGVIGIIADFMGIIGFFMSIVLLFITDATRREMSGQRSDYKEESAQLRNELRALRINVWEDDLLNMETVSSIREKIYTFENDKSKKSTASPTLEEAEQAYISLLIEKGYLTETKTHLTDDEIKQLRRNIKAALED